MNTVPGFLRQVFLLFQERKNAVFDAYPKADKTLLIVDAAQMVIGLLLLGNVRKIVSWIELRRRKAFLENSLQVIRTKAGFLTIKK